MWETNDRISAAIDEEQETAPILFGFPPCTPWFMI